MAAALAIVLPVALAPAPAQAAQTAQASLGKPSARSGEPSDELAAFVRARKTGERVEVVSRRTETRQVFANPKGTFTLEESSLPERVRRGRKWIATDPTLVKAKDGTVRPVAAVVDLAFSGGGDSNLVKLGLGANRLGLGWKGKLPVPRLDGDTATYPEILPGVDLQMRAGLEGFSQLLVVKTPEAARNPALHRIRFAVDAKGMRINRTAQGGLEVLSASGGPVFHGAEAAMWDSKIASAQGAAAKKRASQQVASALKGRARAAGPGVGATRRTIGVELGRNELAVVPDRAMLGDRATRFPVFIDPPVNMGRARWAKVSSGYANQEYPNGGIDGPYGETGNSGDSSKIWRTFYRFSVNSKLHGKQILSSYFHIYNSHSWSCTDKAVQVWRTGGFSNATNWNNQPSWIDHLDTVTAAKGYSASCPGGSIKFNVKAAVAEAAAGKWSTLTLGLKVPSGSEGDSFFWKKFKSTASATKIVTEYNTVPLQPATSDMHMLPGGACGSFDSPAWVNNLKPRMYAKLKDGDNSVKGNFQIHQYDAVNADPLVASFTSPMNSSGREHTWDVPAGKLKDGTLYRFNVQASDGLATSKWSAHCWFKVDTSNPAGVPTATSTDYPDTDTAPDGVNGVGRPGRFRLSANGDTDITAFRYGLDDPDCTEGPEPARNAAGTANQAGGFADIAGTPRAEGVRTLYAVGVDAAGNWGSAGCKPIYYFHAAGRSPSVAHFAFDEGEGAAGQDTDNPDRTATLGGGATWDAGRINKALSLNGSTAHAESPPVVDTAKAFTVSAWAKLQDRNGLYTVAAQSGSTYNGFQLYYSSGYDRWVFVRHAADVANTAAIRAIGVKPGVVGAWTHLLGTYDPGTQQIRLYVNGRLEGWASFTTPWNATGGLQIGRGKVEGAYSAYFKGQIDDVRVWQRVVTEPPPAPEAYFRLDEPDGTVPRDEIYEGRTLTLAAGATQTDEGKFNRGLSFDGTTAAAAQNGAAVVRTDQAFTVAAWVRLANKNANMSMLSQKGTIASGFQMSYYKAGDKWAFGIFESDTDTYTQARVYSSGTATLGWTHLMGVYDPVAKQVRLYVNGRLQGSTEFTAPWHASGPLQVGRTWYAQAWKEPFAGRIDDIKVWDQAIEVDQYRSQEAPHDMADPADPASKSEIWHLANRPLQVRAHWSLDEVAPATTVADSSPNGVDATLVGGAAFGPGNEDDGGLVLDGVDDEAVTTKKKIVQTDRSFSVAAMVQLTEPPGTWPSNKPGVSAVSQDGAMNSGFQLHARRQTTNCETTDAPCYKWTFTTATTDDASVTPVRSVSEDLTNPGEWVHLVGVYDMTDRQLRLYVGGELVRSAQVPFTTAWSAEDVFRIGTAKWKSNTKNDFFPGTVDDVRVYAGVMSAEDITSLEFGQHPPDVVN